MAYSSFLQRSLASLTISTMLVACSAEGLVPPASVDGGRVGAITPVETSRSYQSAQPPVRQAGQTADYLNTPNLGAQGEIYSGAPQQSAAASGNQPMAIPQDGVNMDEGLGVAPVVGLAQEQQLMIAEGSSSQPVVDGIGTDNPVQLSGQAPPAPVWGDQSPVVAPRRASPAPAPQQVAMLPRAENPTAQRAPVRRDVMPASEASCRAELRRLGVSFRDIPRISDGPTCGIDYPVELSGLSGGVAIRPAVKLNCQVTLAFAKWVKYELVPSSRMRYLSGVERITPMGGYSCRKMNSRASNPWSEHARGNAIDIGTIKLKNGKTIDVRKKSFFAFREKGLLKAVRNDSCKYFSTVLGPGSDPNHWNHFHFDLRTRKSGYRHCD